MGVALAGLLLLIVLRFGATAPPTRIMADEAAKRPGVATGADAAVPSPAGVTLRDLVYFGTAWQLLSKKTGTAPIVLGAGYGNPRIERTDDGLFFAGIVERSDGNGAVTDVVLAFAGAQRAGDFIQGNLLARGQMWGEPQHAAVLFERVWDDPRYARARIHVTGHSLGAGYAQIVGAAAIARHGLKAVAARVTIVAFGVPNWGTQSARHFRLRPDVLDRVFTGYTALNDPVITNGGVARVGVSYYLPPFDKLTGPASMANAVAAHWPTTYMSALGMPDWLSARQQADADRTVSALFITGDSRDPSYGRSGDVPIIVEGSVGRDVIRGTPGDDPIAGMAGRDTLRGGGGDDRFLLLASSDSGLAAAADEILDFEPGDRIDLSRLDADDARPGQQRFTLVRARRFTAPAQAATWSAGDTTWIAGNTDGDADADFLINVHGRHHLSNADFVWAPHVQDRLIEPYLSGKASILTQHSAMTAGKWAVAVNPGAVALDARTCSSACFQRRDYRAPVFANSLTLHAAHYVPTATDLYTLRPDG